MRSFLGDFDELHAFVCYRLALEGARTHRNLHLDTINMAPTKTTVFVVNLPPAGIDAVDKESSQVFPMGVVGGDVRGLAVRMLRFSTSLYSPLKVSLSHVLHHAIMDCTSSVSNFL